MSRFSIATLLAILFSISIVGCSSMTNKQTRESQRIPFKYVQNTFIAVPMTVSNSVNGIFILDTGIGINLLSKSVCEKLGCTPTHDHVGHRMSGQELKVSMAKISSLAIGSVVRTDIAVGVYDIESLMPDENIIGFVGLDFFETVPFTVDYKNKNIILESPQSIKEILTRGHAASLVIDRKDDALSVMIKMQLNDKLVASMEIDTGSQALILNKKYMEALKIRENDSAVKRKDGQDETGHSYSRFFTQLSGDVHIDGVPEIKEHTPKVMFQKIIYDGLLGHNFLSQYKVTYDLPHSRIIFNKLE